MFYVLANNIVWIAAALAVGLAVGWLTTTRANNHQFSGGWVIVAAILLIGGGFVASSGAAIPGRAGLTFDTGLLLATAYVVGLPLGGGVKLLAPAPTPEPPSKRPKIVVVRGDAQEARPEVTTPPAPVMAKAPVSSATRGGNGAHKPTAGAKPQGLDAPRGGAPDNLSKIKGLGPKSREKLNSLGVFHYDQIAAWTPEEARWIGATLGVPGRVERSGWIAQAKNLAEPSAPTSIASTSVE